MCSRTDAQDHHCDDQSDDSHDYSLDEIGDLNTVLNPKSRSCAARKLASI